MDIDYYSSSWGSVAKRLDSAWSDYQDSSLPDEQRLNALEYMIYILDINFVSHSQESLNELLVKLMDTRAQKKDRNPDYIPILRSGRYQLETKARVLQSTKTSNVSDDNEIQQAFKAHKLLDVNRSDKHNDKVDRITYLTAEQRAEYNIQIHEGLFKQSGDVFDSSHYIAHKKPGYVAFTFNTNGELSVFNHLGGRKDSQGRRLAHSSMNAGSPILATGEMEIKQGKLVSINTFSGRYEPSLYSLTLFLEYLSDRDIDISETKVYLQKPIKETSGLQSAKVYIKGDIIAWYVVSATALLMNVRAIMERNLYSINEYLNSLQTRLYRDVFRLDSTKKSLYWATRFYKSLVKCYSK